MSRRRPSGRCRIVAVSSIPRVAAQIWRSYWRTRWRSWVGNCLLRIHHSTSRARNCDLTFLAVVECRNTWISIQICCIQTFTLYFIGRIRYRSLGELIHTSLSLYPRRVGAQFCWQECGNLGQWGLQGHRFQN